MDPSRISQVKHLFAVEHLSMRQISRLLHLCQRTVSRILAGREKKRRAFPPSPLVPFVRLIEEWYRQYPSLQAAQIRERLKAYGYTGSYRSLCRFTEQYRKKRRKAYHELEFLPGEVAQVDWMEATLSFGKVYGFVFILAYSRYLFLKFYPRSSMEFFLDGHVSAYEEIKGAARRNWYDNLHSVVMRRKPELTFNATFLDYARHVGFSIHACTPGRANEKGRVERVIRDARGFVETTTFTDLADLNRKTDLWRKERNERIHRATGKMPVEALAEEPLLPLPALPYKPYRLMPASISTTAFVTFETNRYSVPTDYAGRPATILAYPDHLEVLVGDRKVAHHPRSFARSHKIEHPSHRETLLARTPNGKYERILRLMHHLGKEIASFLTRAASEGEDPYAIAYGFFKLLKVKVCSKEMLLSAVREAYTLGSYKLRSVESLLAPHEEREVSHVYPQNTRLLDITYTGRELADYDDLT
ncbi:MAG: IS21 family transposase [Deltaproteobacteria bacterium]